MTTTTTPCPSWCTQHPATEPDAHQSVGWRAYGLSVVVEQDADTTIVHVDNGPKQSLGLTPEQAHELGLELVRAARRVRVDSGGLRAHQ
jgi:hypothetical protein